MEFMPINATKKSNYFVIFPLFNEKP